MKKLLLFTGLTIFFLSSCNNGKLSDKNIFKKDVSAVMNEVGIFEKVEYRFVGDPENDSKQNTKSFIELKLYNSHLSSDNPDKEAVSKKYAKKFIINLVDGKKYHSVLVSFIDIKKDGLKTITLKRNFNFATSSL